MTFAYPRSNGASSLPSYNQQRSQSSNILSRVGDSIPVAIKQWLSVGGIRIRRGYKRTRDAGIKATTLRLIKSIFTISNAIILLWMFSIRWGERTVFEEHINQCLWDSWEEWVSIQWRLSQLETCCKLY
jgi:hypothetical protein